MSELFNYKVEGVPDLDQRHDLLPSNGASYCHVASAMNWLYFIAKHGRPGALLTNSDLSNEANILVNMLVLGAYMDVNPSSGTSFWEAFDGLEEWLEDRNVPSIVVGTYYDEDVNITFNTLRGAVQVGGLVTLGIGRFVLDDGEFVRVSGHAVSMVGLKKNDDLMKITAHNPWSTDSLTQQSPTEDAVASVTHKWGDFDGDEATLLQWGPGTDPYRMVVGFLTIVPLFALTNVNKTLAYYVSADWGASSVMTQEIALPFDGGVADIALHPGEPSAAIYETGGRDIWLVDLATKTLKPFATLDAPLTGIVYGGRNHRLWASAGRTVVGLDSQGRVRERQDLPMAPDRLTFDPRGNQLHAWTTRESVAVSLDRMLNVLGQHRIPPLDQLPPAARELVLQPPAVGFRARATRPTPVVEGGVIRYVDLAGNRVRGIFDGLPAGSVLRVARSGHNFDPAKRTNPAWRDA